MDAIKVGFLFSTNQTIIMCISSDLHWL